MSANGFKIKPLKKTKTNDSINITLDSKHKEIMSEFEKDNGETIPSLKEEKVNIIKSLNEKGHTVEERLLLQDKVKDINQKIQKIKLKKKEYLLDNSKHIFDYFENKKNISNVEGSNTSKNKKIDNFFKISDKTEKDVSNINTSSIVNKYLSNVDESFININSYIHSSNVCQFCKKGEMIPLEDEGVLLCNLCFRNSISH